MQSRSFHSAVTAQRHQYDYWRQFVRLPELHIECDSIARAWQGSRDLILGFLRQKQASPLESLELDEATIHAVERYANAVRNVASVNTQLLARNEAIQSVKSSAKASDLIVLQRELSRLNCTKARFGIPLQGSATSTSAQSMRRMKRNDEKRSRGICSIVTDQLFFPAIRKLSTPILGNSAPATRSSKCKPSIQEERLARLINLKSMVTPYLFLLQIRTP